MLNIRCIKYFLFVLYYIYYILLYYCISFNLLFKAICKILCCHADFSLFGNKIFIRSLINNNIIFHILVKNDLSFIFCNSQWLLILLLVCSCMFSCLQFIAIRCYLSCDSGILLCSLSSYLSCYLGILLCSVSSYWVITL